MLFRVIIDCSLKIDDSEGFINAQFVDVPNEKDAERKAILAVMSLMLVKNFSEQDIGRAEFRVDSVEPFDGVPEGDYQKAFAYYRT
ncbi:hypothetical protein [Sphingomonas psychrotolerans]|uniref:Uncharacterized protein n=1 Tax=Sphingomonas psychrotolerans TaxID=1327635 RepID=A0A2K8M9Z0_9SPHN|nr:hypothetical protein [Sphingomonas psychrotolerans]ATY30702.1 hypothetical protein CVN68_00785 [Sphingomonas psychrotolerans]